MKAKRPALAAAAQSEGGSLIRNEKLKQLYMAMLRYRLMEQRVSSPSAGQQPRATQPGPAGCEATEIGCTIDLRSRDAIALPNDHWLSAILQRPSLRTHLGGRLRSIQHVGEQAAEQLIASADRLKSTKMVVVVFADHATPFPWGRVLKRAGSQSLPFIFVERANSSFNSNGPRGRRSKLRAEDFGCPEIPVDAHDVVAVYRVAHESIQRARRGGGPTLIQCQPYLVENGTATGTRGTKSDAKDGRRNGATAPQKNSLDWTTKDPIEQMEQYLIRKGLFQNSWKNRIVREFSKQLDLAFGSQPKADLHETTYPSV
ncbi:MAG TPA: thiamine pyrophosphate-dependent enzyme [Acidobacteriaceae bacterium]